MTEKYDNTNRGALWPNRYKTGTEEDQNKPDYAGKAEVKCLHCGAVSDVRVSLWDNRQTAEFNQPKMKLAFSEKKRPSADGPAW